MHYPDDPTVLTEPANKNGLPERLKTGTRLVTRKHKTERFTMYDFMALPAKQFTIESPSQIG
jgi:hypothetical protein